MSVKPKVVNGFSRTFVCKMDAGPSTNLYSIGGDPLTQLIFVNYIFLNFVFFIRNTDNEKMNETYFVGDPLTHLCNQSTSQPKHSTSSS